MFLPVVPMMTPSSTSQSTCEVTLRSTGTSSNGPFTVVGVFEKITGMSGIFVSLLRAAALSLACAT